MRVQVFTTVLKILFHRSKRSLPSVSWLVLIHSFSDGNQEKPFHKDKCVRFFTTLEYQLLWIEMRKIILCFIYCFSSWFIFQSLCRMSWNLRKQLRCHFSFTQKRWETKLHSSLSKKYLYEIVPKWFWYDFEILLSLFFYKCNH